MWWFVSFRIRPEVRRKSGVGNFFKEKFSDKCKHIVTFPFWMFEISRIHPLANWSIYMYLPFFKFFSHVFCSRSFTPGSSLATELRKSTEDLRRQDFMTKPWEKKPSEVSQLTSQNDPNNIYIYIYVAQWCIRTAVGQPIILVLLLVLAY